MGQRQFSKIYFLVG